MATWPLGNPATRFLVVVVVFLLVLRQRRVFEGELLARLDAAHDLDAGVVGEAADDLPLLEEGLPSFLVVLLRVLRGRLERLRVDLLFHEDDLAVIALEDRLDR